MNGKSFLLGRVPMSSSEFAFFVEIFELTKGPASTYSSFRKITRPPPRIGGEVVWSTRPVPPKADE